MKTIIAIILSMILTSAMAQTKKQLVRIAKIEVDSAQLKNYLDEVKEIGETSLRTEPGVLMLFSVSDKHKPNQITVIEIYADSAAYQRHIQTAHFKKYKEVTKNMVKSLELVDVDPIFAGIKPEIMNK